MEFLHSPWKADKFYKFLIAVDKRNLKFQLHWFEKYSWLVYTTSGQEGVLCKVCVLFAGELGGKSKSQPLKYLVSQPYNKWKNALEYFHAHNNCEYHKTSILMAENCSKIYKNESRDIRNELHSARNDQIMENRKKLIPIISTIILCGRQEVALRGTNDSGVIKFDGTEPLINDGNFRALLRMRYEAGDQNLSKHAQNLAHNATYYSTTIQNEIISIRGKMVQKHIVKTINSAEYFFANETSDITLQEQMSLCVRYVEQKGDTFTMYEEFLTFVSVECTKGEYLANTIISTLRSLNIKCENMIGQ